MKKALLLGALTAICLITDLQAKTRNLAEARLCATAICPNASEVKSIHTNFTPYYIFNDKEAQKFVLVSGSDQTRPIIGYGEGEFDPENMPDNLRDWLKMISEDISRLEADGSPRLQRQASSTTAITPFMEHIKWAQGYPYNLRCPAFGQENSPAGCIATAAAQCIYYYRYPSQGAGMHTDANEPSLSVNFSTSTYDYDLMFDSFMTSQNADGSWTHSYTDAQMYEVAKLTYHCGIMCDMAYTQQASGAKFPDLLRGLIENMQYDPSAQIVMRRTRTYEEWDSLLQNELRHTRPVIISGSSDNNTSGHSFVLDGLDEQGLYHVNWGWAGVYNGYYDITIMRPEDGEVKVNPDGYCAEQMAIIQLAPRGKVFDAQYISPLCALNGEFSIPSGIVKMGSTIKFNLSKFYNYSPSTFQGRLGLVFVRDGKTITFLPANADPFTLNPYYGFSASDISVTLPYSLPAGNYRVYPAVRDEGTTFYGQSAIIYSNANRPSFANCRIDNGNATFSTDSYETMIEVRDWNFEQQELRAAIPQEITCIVTNQNPNVTATCKFILMLTAPDGTSRLVESREVCVLPTGDSQQVSFPITFSTTGKWSCQLYVFRQNLDFNALSDSRLIKGSDRSFSVTSDGTTEAHLTLLQAPELISDARYGDSLFVNQYATFELSVRNTGKAYNGSLQIQLYKTATSTTALATITQKMEIPANSEATYTLCGTLVKENSNFSTALSGTTYYAKAAYDYAGSYQLLETPSGISNRTTVKCYSRVPATDLDTFPMDDDHPSIIYNLQGQRINPNHPLTHGIYIINGKAVWR